MWGGPGLWGSRAVAAGSPAWPGPGKRGDPQQQPPAVLPSPEQPRLWERPNLPGAGTAGTVWLLKGLVGQEASHAGSPTSFRRHKTPKLESDSDLQAERGRNRTAGHFRKWGDNGTGHKRDACWHLCHVYHSRPFPSYVVSQKATTDCFWKGAEGRAEPPSTSKRCSGKHTRVWPISETMDWDRAPGEELVKGRDPKMPGRVVQHPPACFLHTRPRCLGRAAALAFGNSKPRRCFATKRPGFGRTWGSPKPHVPLQRDDPSLPQLTALISCASSTLGLETPAKSRWVFPSPPLHS